MARSEAAISIVQFDGAAMTHTALVPTGATFRVEGQHVQRLDGPPDGARLRAFADECDVARNALYTILPRHLVTVRLLTLPARDADEIASMVALSAEEFVPYSRESLIVRHRAIETLPSGETRVLLALVHRDVLDQHLALLSAAGLEPADIFLSTACMHAAALAAPDAPTGRFAMIHLGAASLEIAVMENGVLQFSRGVVHPEAWDLDDPHSLESLRYELRDALSAYRRECDDGLGVETLYVATDGPEVTAFAATLDEVTGKTCHVATFLEGILDGSPGRVEPVPLPALGAGLAALNRAPLSLSFLPETIASKRAFRGVQRQVLQVAALGGIVLLALAAWFVQAVIQRSMFIAELEAQAADLAPSAQGVAAKQDRLRIISHQVDLEGSFLPLLAAVAQAAPESGFNITRILYSRGEGLDIWGRAMSKDLVLTDFLGSLRSMGEGGLSMLARAHSQYETAGRERNQLVFNYHVTVPVVAEEEDGHVVANR